MWKLSLDRLVAFSVLIVLLVPVFLPLALIIYLTDRGSAIYSQVRIGKGGNPFRLYKFRSMVCGADRQGYQTQMGDARITSIGRFLRKTSLDELPQLWNVLKGDMSLVGPRPDTPMQRTNYTEAEWDLRHSVRPGITGLAQINGRSNITPEERLRLDLEYARNHNMYLDISILLKTILACSAKNTN